MPFSKSFPKPNKTGSYTQWEEIALSEAEELQSDADARKENIALMKECINDAKNITITENMKDYQTDLVHIAIALFEKRASHAVYFKENKAKEKFDKIFNA